MFTLSTKVSLLTILLVLLVPVFNIGQYPEADLSIRAWSDRLEAEYLKAYQELAVVGAAASNASSASSGLFLGSVQEMVRFYDDVAYFPLWMDGYPQQLTVSGRPIEVPGGDFLQGQPPPRLSNVLKHEVQECLLHRPGCDGVDKATLYFDFRHYVVLTAIEDMLLIVAMVTIMMLAAFGLSRTLDRILVKPLEHMLGTVNEMASDLLRSFPKGKKDDTVDRRDSDDDSEEVVETEMLDQVVQKLARLSALSIKTNVATEEELANMRDEDRGVLDMMHVDVQVADTTAPAASAAAPPAPPSQRSSAESHEESLATGDSQLRAGPLAASELEIESWGSLNVLEMDSNSKAQVVNYLFFESSSSARTGRQWIDTGTFQEFHSAICQGYNDQPYHNYEHAVDVLHAVSWLLKATCCSVWLKEIEQYALMVAALGHDVGHFGRANPFLIETQHGLAVRYNDKSPLENMHCAKLFDICGDEDKNIFKMTDLDSMKLARKVCIETILHTDLAMHFDMVKEVSQAYEIASSACEAQAQAPAGVTTADYEEQVLKKHTMLWLELFLHMADVSNPLKPFRICELWAHRVLDEFFAQGDEEKRLGLPVGMLNDRNKVSREGSQHGFINFLVAPLVFGAVRSFPPLHPLAAQMGKNLQAWRDAWAEQAKPSEEELAKKDVDVQKIRTTAAELSARVQPVP